MMKTSTLFITAAIALAYFNSFGQKDDASAAGTQYFGERIDEEGAITTAQFVKAMGGKETMDVKVTAKIRAVCQKKGCWMDLDLGDGSTMKVRFKDYEFFVPKDADGKMAVVEGNAKVETVDVATLQHYARDAGKPEDEVAAITKPERSISFEARGVIIK